MQFVQGLPHGVYVGQTQIEHPAMRDAKDEAFRGFNLALHVGDEAARVQQHRMQLLTDFAAFGVDKISWLNQTHSTDVHTINSELMLSARTGDGLVTQTQGHALMMMTADCLPVVLGNADATEVANLHAGWKGLAQGIVENTIAHMQTQPTWAWLGAAISQTHFEIGAEVKRAFCEKYPTLEGAFVEGKAADKFYADLYAIARYILAEHGITQIYGGDQCSYAQQAQYYSYRRAAKTGRMATFVFIAKSC